MQNNQPLRDESELRVDLLAWRIENAKRRETLTTRNKAYNLRPRLRNEAHQ